METTPAGYPLDPTLFTLEALVGDLAAEWRATKSDKIVKQYHAVLRCLLECGWDGFLDYDAALPKRLMPQEYFDHVQRKAATLESPKK